MLIITIPRSASPEHGQPSGGEQGQATDIMIHAAETQKIKDQFWENQARLKESLEEGGLI